MPAVVIVSDDVLVPYKITLLSNRNGNRELAVIVLVPYKITLLSNTHFLAFRIIPVLVPY